MIEELIDIRTALRGHIYETTCLSLREDDGGHWCKIGVDTLKNSREALAKLDAVISRLESKEILYDIADILCAYGFVSNVHPCKVGQDIINTIKGNK